MTRDPSFEKERRATQKFFNRVAFVFPVIERSLVPEYKKKLYEFDLPSDCTVLDLATGTGILAAAFAERGHSVTGLDFAEKLLRRARKNFPHLTFRHFDLFHLEQIEDKAFDIVTMGYFLHGVDPQFRRFVLEQAARIAARYVVVFDYCCKGNWLVRLIEWLEGPHYPQFVSASRQDEFKAAGLQIRKELYLSDYGAAWLCTPVPSLKGKERENEKG